MNAPALSQQAGGHTPTPWAFSKRGQRIYGGKSQGRKIAQLSIYDGREKDAAFIVRAVNSHAALVEALERIGWHELTAKEARDAARAALAQSEAE